MESCHFRDLASEFAELDAARVGISADPVDRQKHFEEQNNLGFSVLSDPDREVHKAFGTKRMGSLPGKRATFVIGQDRVVIKEIRSETNMLAHADEALDALRNLAS